MSTVSLPTGTKHRDFTAIECNMDKLCSDVLFLKYLKSDANPVTADKLFPATSSE